MQTKYQAAYVSAYHPSQISNNTSQFASWVPTLRILSEIWRNATHFGKYRTVDAYAASTGIWSGPLTALTQMFPHRPCSLRYSFLITLILSFTCSLKVSISAPPTLWHNRDIPTVFPLIIVIVCTGPFNIIAALKNVMIGLYNTSKLYCILCAL